MKKTRYTIGVAEQGGRPTVVRCDNGPEFTSRHFLSWCEERHIGVRHFSRADRCRMAWSKASTKDSGMNA